MQYSLKTLMFVTSILALFAALIAKFEGLGLLYGLVIILALLIFCSYAKMPLSHGEANWILFGAIVLHISLINYFLPVAAKWANEEMYTAEKCGHKFYVESQEDSLIGFMVVLGYLPAIGAMLIRILRFHIWECSGFTRLGLSLWLLVLPFLSAWYTIHHYNSFCDSVPGSAPAFVFQPSGMIVTSVHYESSSQG